MTVNKLHKHMFIIFFLAGVAFSLGTREASANHLEIEDFAVYDTNETTNQITFECDISWDNSWRTTTNYDAVWVFLKYSTDAGVTWKHARMSSSGVNPTGFNAPANFEILVPEDRTGFFLQRTDHNAGDVSAESVRFVWDYNQDGLTDAQAMAANTINKVFGIEMVYIPQGSFYAGDGNSSSDYRFKEGSADNDPWYIQNENAITTTNAASNGHYYTHTGAAGENGSGAIFIVPSSFPKGYRAFYLMKYELTEGQWVSFFNTLPLAARTNRDITGSSEGGKGSDAVVKRNTVAWDSAQLKSDATTLRPERPVTYVSWPDVTAYADWAALRPVTEFEYEKAARGADINPVPDEYVWGTTSYNDALASEITPNTDEDGTETISDSGANLNRNNLSWTSGDGRPGGIAESQEGPLRAGIFAESGTNRASSGGGYYGNMELSGNLHEMVVTVGRTEGRQFLGTHGDGRLSTLSGYEGNATNTDWPGINTTDSARGVTSSVGSGYRGGDFDSTNLRHFQTSTRTYAVKDADSEGYYQRFDASFGVMGGGRLGRYAPTF